MTNATYFIIVAILSALLGAGIDYGLQKPGRAALINDLRLRPGEIDPNDRENPWCGVRQIWLDIR